MVMNMVMDFIMEIIKKESHYLQIFTNKTING